MIKQNHQLQQTNLSATSMGKKHNIEVCLISARGLPRSSLWKHHWFAVGWIDPNNKYCTKIDTSGNPNPVWKTKFSEMVDGSVSDSQDLALCIEVYSRDPIFLGEKLKGVATVNLREFLTKYKNKCEEGSSNSGNEDVGSFQLRKKYSDKPQGFVDVSIRVFEDKEVPTSSFSYLGSEEGFNLNDGRNNINLATEAGPMQPYPTGHAATEPQFHLPGKTDPHSPSVHYPYTHPLPYPTNYQNPNVGGPSYPPAYGPSYPPSLPQPPSNAGYIPSFYPQIGSQSATYMNMPSSGVGGGAGVGRGGGPAFAVGMGAGALAAGAVIFGDDLMSGFQLPTRMNDPTLVISTDPPL